MGTCWPNNHSRNLFESTFSGSDTDSFLIVAALCTASDLSGSCSLADGLFVRTVATFSPGNLFSLDDRCHQRKRQIVQSRVLNAMDFVLIEIGNPAVIPNATIDSPLYFPIGSDRTPSF